jgi:5'-nucleotidase
MRVLVTNDDGVAAAGLRALAAAMVAEGHDVVVVAPSGPANGVGTALRTGDGQPIALRRSEHADLPGVPFVGIDGGPALAVLLARLGAFGPAPWCVVSGINHGANTGRSVLHSGTVAAALTASSMGMSGLAVSIASERPAHLATAAGVARAAVRVLRTARKRTVLNVNVPDLPAERLGPARWARLAAAGSVAAAVAEVTDEHVTLRLAPSALPQDPETDAGLLAAGHVVVTPLTGVRVPAATELGLPDPVAALAQLTTRPPTC